MKKGIWVLILMVFGVACNKTELNRLSFDVSTASSTYKVGDTVVFNFSGNAEYVVFYSGENGFQYQYKNRTTAVGKPFLNFLSYRQFGNMENTLQLMLSSNFSGIYDSANIQNATWTDITSRAVLSTTKDSTPSGNIDLSDFVKGDSIVYIGFRYYAPKDGISSQRAWTIRGLSMINKLQDSSFTTLLDMSSGNWLGVNMLNRAAVWSISTSQLRISGGDKNAATNEDWLVSKGIKLTRVLPDEGISIKTLVDPSLKTFNHIYTKAGTYTVVFDAKNANDHAMEAAQKTLVITVQ